MVTGGSSLHQAYKLFGGTQSFGLSAWIVVFAATELLSCQVNPTGSMPKTALCLQRQDCRMGLLLCPSASARPPPPFPHPPPLPNPCLVSVFNMPAGHSHQSIIPALSLAHSAGLRLQPLS